MITYSTPGVTFEWLDTQRSGVQPVRTDVAGFVGIAERGPLHVPLRVESWVQFTSLFGRHLLQAYLAYAVQAFFVNGGQACYVVRVADAERASPAHLDLQADMGQPGLRPTGAQQGQRFKPIVGGDEGWAIVQDLLHDPIQPVLRLTASSPGTWGQAIAVTARLVAPGRFTLILQLPTGEQETWPNLSMDPGDPRFAVDLLEGRRSRANQGDSVRSLLVRASMLDWPELEPAAMLKIAAVPKTQRLVGGSDGLTTLQPEHLVGAGATSGQVWGLAALEQEVDVAIVAIPDIMPFPQRPLEQPPYQPPSCLPAEDEPVGSVPVHIEHEAPPPFDGDEIRFMQQALVGHCEKTKNRMAILDPFPANATPDAILRRRMDFDSKYAALYYPWISMPDPLQPEGALCSVPPSGHVLGIYARIERETGVHKAPANEILEAAADVALDIDDVVHGVLNDGQVNVIRALPGRGLRVLGARTLSSEIEWRYVNVRRLLIMIERAIERQTQWIVFEPNNRQTWRDTDRVIRSFLDGIWRRGMLDGASQEEAYRVVCDETSNPPSEIEQGRLQTVIGVLPAWPAEFVIVRIGRTETGTQVLEGSHG